VTYSTILKICLIVVVLYAGRDTKLMKNSGKPKFKRTKIDHWLNKIILGVYYFLSRNSYPIDFCFFTSDVFDNGDLSWILGV
jgi:hypothetical protein